MWFADLSRLHEALGALVVLHSNAKIWTILLEFEIPRKEKRIDVVLLANETIIILELKSSYPGLEGLRQAEEYALLLHYFHRPSNRRKIVTFLVTPDVAQLELSQQIFLPIEEAPAFWLAPVEAVSWRDLTAHLSRISASSVGSSIDPSDWLNGEYRPVPTIIDAARSLQSGLNVREVAHSHAARHDVEKLTAFVDQLIASSKIDGRHTICFITGVPGSGKTLVGLNLAFASGDQREPIHFMSGTGPLVKVLQEVLARNHRLRHDARAQDSKRYAKTLLENVHVFAREYSERDTERAPSNHVIIFDEAQRAWNLQQNLRKFKRDYSEPEMLLRIMERHQDWAVVICLVGGGQEINSGEAGLSEWGHALAHTTAKSWDIIASPQALEGGPEVAGSRLFEAGNDRSSVRGDSQLHLDTTVRSLGADSYSRWTNFVVEGNAAAAMALGTHNSFPIFLTRSLKHARQLLKENMRGESRCGLVGSSKAARLRAEGLEPDNTFHGEYPWEHWYLAGPSDVRSSHQLEVFTTEFEIQGLELDWIGLCWGGDFIWSNSAQQWMPRRFNPMTSKWSAIKPEDQRLYRKNSYRVLLTRARQGIVLFVPEGDSEDPTRNPREFDETANFLLACGAQMAHPEDVVLDAIPLEASSLFVS